MSAVDWGTRPATHPLTSHRLCCGVTYEQPKDGTFQRLKYAGIQRSNLQCTLQIQ